MILSTHFMVGAAVANYTDSLVWLALLPLGLHFLLDSLPHWEYADTMEELKQKIPQVVIDVSAGPLIIMAVSLLHGFDVYKTVWLLVGGTIGMLPDGLSLLHSVFPQKKLLKKFFDFHLSLHTKKKLGRKIGFGLQIVLDFLAVMFIGFYR